MNETELKGCPCCGGEAKTVGMTQFGFVICDRCGMASGTCCTVEGGRTWQEQAAEKWNRRVIG